ncbi:MAG TPA: hypothetical protein DCQ26_09440 [Marinilabiliales bacterium]|jgi:hypothetical protein|nr:MAG: hypothetical protein A2W95_02475 [Bacteroidetes bacterium GWA2_40_14]OFX63297.1 MAG: hypothetical protein A2W84_03150 [Bacteroidetes bacterium GWC2_40_13]OFX74605.1 MAG: hypothetical protein A2W96_03990 [Bacteroidetes bacterium GWD2_40_43]OFX88971.1 MAG: hypothetical protein A2W97_09930 [Bacteroidetes bacterium GWE2_40_63]OFY22777.1 MAG: hypothetical protein A2W88_00220 [Bacteroidetes bacterium GWF2_40_13]OFZ32125.1 MAG: hypothetical protein A2437_19235 [Bacteroidetes bacterium RIFOXYC
MKCLFISILIFVTWLGQATCQDFSIDEQYKQALANAKLAFEAKQYSQAVVFYREAQKIKPGSLLPKYKIEDIRTIYIEKEKKIQPTVDSKTKKKETRKTTRAKEQNPATEDEIIRETATRKMNEEADLVEKELKTLKVEAAVINEEPAIIDTTAMVIAEVEKDRETTVAPIEKKNTPHLTTTNNTKTEVSPILEKRETSVVNKADSGIPEKKNYPESINTTKPSAASQPIKKVKTALTEEERKIWIEQEQKRLAVSYPNKKTVEELDQPGKHITRVIMNINQKVVIYLKVKHSWGATFFFIDEVGQELKSINEQYFNLMTNLDIYGN